MQVAFIIYAVGLACGIFLLALASRTEPTSHGKSILWTVGLLTVALWPVALAWAAIVGIGWCAVQIKDRLIGR